MFLLNLRERIKIFFKGQGMIHPFEMFWNFKILKVKKRASELDREESEFA